jgi:hypothetical protein
VNAGRRWFLLRIRRLVSRCGSVVDSGDTDTSCLFCESRFVAGAKGEDVVPRWCAKHIGHPVTSEVWLVHADREAGAAVGDRRRSQTVAAADFRRRSVCQECKNGWMSQIESAAKPVVLSMLEGGTRVLTNMTDASFLGTAQVAGKELGKTRGK